VNAAIYTRISKDREGLELGVDRQEEACRALASQRGWDVVQVYRDNDLSASSGKRRPGWESLLSDLEAGNFCAVMAYSSSRMYRRPADLRRLVEIAKSGNLEIATVASGQINLDTADGRMLAGILAEVDQAEVDRMSERVRAAQAQRRASGRHHGGGRRPYGYTRERTVDPREAEVVRQMVDMALGGASATKISAWLNAQGATTAQGARWRPDRVRDILLAPFHSGRFPSGAKGEWEALITPEEQELMRVQLEDPSRQQFVREGRRYTLSGLVRCGECGQPMLGGNGSYRCMKIKGGCGHVAIKASILDRYVFEGIREWLPKSGLLHAVASEPNTESRKNREELLREITTLRTRLDQLAEDYAGGVLDSRQMKVAGDALRSKLKDLEDQVRATSPEAPMVDVLSIYALKDTDGWDAERRLQAREIARLTVGDLRVGKGRGLGRVSLTFQ